jgi:hypothetical protein
MTEQINKIPVEKKDDRIIISISKVNKEKFTCEAQKRGLSLTNFFTFSVLKEINGGNFQNDSR